MIDFRYHLVSIIAIFMALAVGILLGSGPLKEPIDQALRDRATQLEKDKTDLRDENSALQSENDYYDAAMAQAIPGLVSGRLAGRTVVVLSLPGAANGEVEKVGETLRAAGASLSGTVQITDAYLDPERADELDGLATQLGGDFPDDSTVSTRAAGLLATSIVTKDPAQERVADTDAAALLAGMSELGFIKVEGEPAKRAMTAVVVTPTAPKTVTDQTDSQNRSLLDLVTALDTNDTGTLVGGPIGSAGKGGFVDAVRSEEQVAARVSSVDSVDTSPGLVAVSLGMVNEIGGRSGHYGIGPGADEPLPEIPGVTTS